MDLSALTRMVVVIWSCILIALNSFQIWVETRMKNSPGTLVHFFHRVCPIAFVFFAAAHAMPLDVKGGFLLNDIFFDCTTTTTYAILMVYAKQMVANAQTATKMNVPREELERISQFYYAMFAFVVVALVVKWILVLSTDLMATESVFLIALAIVMIALVYILWSSFITLNRHLEAATAALSATKSGAASTAMEDALNTFRKFLYVLTVCLIAAIAFQVKNSLSYLSDMDAHFWVHDPNGFNFFIPIILVALSVSTAYMWKSVDLNGQVAESTHRATSKHDNKRTTMATSAMPMNTMSDAMLSPQSKYVGQAAANDCDTAPSNVV